MPGPGLRLDLLADLASLGGDLPTPSTPAGARAFGAQGHGPIFSDFSGPVAPPSLREREHIDRPPDPDTAALWEERAAIAEHEGGWSRSVAEAIASRQVKLIAEGAGPEAWADLDRELIDLERRKGARLWPGPGLRR